MRPLMIFSVLSILLQLMGCQQNHANIFGDKKSHHSSDAIATLEPDTKASDRPVDTGAGVPGYLVDCSIYQTQETRLTVGCKITDADRNRVKTPVEAWESYELKLPAEAPAGYSIAKKPSVAPALWDVDFDFAGGPLANLKILAETSVYTYTFQDSQGQSIRIETNALKPDRGIEILPENLARTSSTFAQIKRLALNNPENMNFYARIDAAEGDLYEHLRTRSAASAQAFCSAIASAKQYILDFDNLRPEDEAGILLHIQSLQEAGGICDGSERL
ncbi:hypothetical protein [Oligoflexus tunisiensis]|uniref:hypothetical protein n=1 Tax=Oligoflexus tunisiensis TaxID=708132 RepID=UPI00114CBB46|nr:hypothetical protein [Oligoflexus tunisiensis]